DDDQLRIGAIAVLTDHLKGNTLAPETRRAEFAVTTADSRIDGDPLALAQSRHSASQAANNPGGIAADDLRHTDFDARHTSTKKYVDVINRRGLHFDEDIAGSGFRIRNITIFEDFRPSVLAKNHCFHGSSSLS